MHTSINLITTMALVTLTSTAFAGESLIATRSVRAGTLLTAADITLKSPEIPGAAHTPEDVIGLEVRRNLYAGRPVLLGDLGPPTLVRRNDRVTVTYRYNGLLIRVEGRALEPGGQGETVRVMNQTSRTTIFARVTGPKNVAVPNE